MAGSEAAAEDEESEGDVATPDVLSEVETFNDWNFWRSPPTLGLVEQADLA